MIAGARRRRQTAGRSGSDRQEFGPNLAAAFLLNRFAARRSTFRAVTSMKLTTVDRVLPSRLRELSVAREGIPERMGQLRLAPSTWREKSNHWTNQSPRSRLPLPVLKGIIDNVRAPLRPSVSLRAATAIFHPTAFVIFMRAFCPTNICAEGR